MTPLTQSIARFVSIIGHPAVLVPVASIWVAIDQGAPAATVQRLVVIAAGLSVFVIGYSLLKVRSGAWQHVDASRRDERRSLNALLIVLLAGAAALAWTRSPSPHLPVALGLLALLCTLALLTGAWIKLSLHVGFACFATALLWPHPWALAAGIAMTIAVAWSRLLLARHSLTEVQVGGGLGSMAGVAYQLLI